MTDIPVIELDFDVSLNTMMIRYYQLQRAYEYLAENAELEISVRDFLIDNLSKELAHMEKILNQELPNESKG